MPLPPLARGQVHVWRVELSGGDPEGCLDPEELQRAGRFHFERDRLRFARARAALRRLLGGYLSRDPSAVRFRYGPNGKPELAEGGPLRFNVSHSEDAALIAVALDRAIGVDVERVRPMPDAARMVERYFAPAEKAHFASLPPSARDAEFFRLWTLKEAFLKAIGEGLTRPLEEASVMPPPEGWHLRELSSWPGCAAALAAEGEAPAIRQLDAGEAQLFSK